MGAPVEGLDECWRIENLGDLDEVARSLKQQILDFVSSLKDIQDTILLSQHVFPPIL